MTGIHVAKPNSFHAVDLKKLGWPLPLSRPHIEPEAMRAEYYEGGWQLAFEDMLVR